MMELDRGGRSHDVVNVPNATKLFTFKGLLLCHVNLFHLNLFKMKEMGGEENTEEWVVMLESKLKVSTG